jgi:hypothetical protein
MSDTGIPGYQTAIDDQNHANVSPLSVRLCRKIVLPTADLCSGKVSEHGKILDTFFLHPWSFVVCHELMLQIVE